MDENSYPTYLIHYGVSGQKWGTRQYQNLDGTWTEEGKRRRRIGDNRIFGRSYESDYNKTGGGIKGDKVFVKDIQKDIQKINGGQKGFEYGLNRNVNCAFCTMAYELRRRGHDVRAQESLRGAQAYLSNPKGAYGRVIPNYSKISKDARTFAMRRSDESSKMSSIGMTKSEYDDMTSKLLSDGDNTRGFIAVDWKGGNGGHIFNYEVKNGQLYFIDAQPGTIVKADKNFFNQTMKNANNVETLRSDNLKIDEDKAKKFYTEDSTSDIRYNTAKLKRDKSMIAASIIGGVLSMSIIGMPITGVVAGQKIVEKKYRTRIEDIEAQASNKWESEGRFKNKWYDFKEDKKKNTKDTTLTEAKQSRIKSLISSGKTQAEVAKLLGVSMSTVNKYK